MVVSPGLVPGPACGALQRQALDPAGQGGEIPDQAVKGGIAVVFHLHHVVTQVAAMFRSSVPGWIEKNDVLGKCEVMINGEAEDDTVFLGKNRNVTAAAIQIRLFIDHKRRRAGKGMADRIIKRVFHDFESGGLAVAVNSKIIVRFFQHPAVAVNEGDARKLKPRQYVRHGIRRQKVIAVEKLDRRQGGGGNACILRLSGAAVGLLDDFAVGEGSDQVFGDFDGTVRGTIIDNNKLPFEVSFLGENAFQGRLKIPFLVVGATKETPSVLPSIQVNRCAP